MGVCCHNSLYGKLPDPFSLKGRRRGRVWLRVTIDLCPYQALFSLVMLRETMLRILQRDGIACLLAVLKYNLYALYSKAVV